MSRRLVQRTQQEPAEQSTASLRRQNAGPHRTTAIELPTYQAPKFPMSDKHQRALAELKSTNFFYSKYREHRVAGVTSITSANADAYDRVHEAKARLEELVEKNAKSASQSEDSSQVGNGFNDKSDAKLEAEKRLHDLQVKVDSLSEEAEKNLRQLVDYGDELHQQDQIMTDVKDQVAIDASQPRIAKKRKTNGHDAEGGTLNITDDEEEAQVEEDLVAELPADTLTPFEVFQKSKANYNEHYAAQTMRNRYAENNDYIGFYRAVHESKHQHDQRPVPHKSTWFSEEGGTATDWASRQGVDNSDDEILIAREKVSLICPLTRQMFKEPYSNNKCPHTYEKSALIDYFRTNARSERHQIARGRRAPIPVGPKTLECAEPGCSARFELSDFRDDDIKLRQVQRAQKEQERERQEGLNADGISDIDDIDDIDADGEADAT